MLKKKPKKENGERWLLTYSDLITLLMIFFVIMYASSNIDKTKYKQIASSFQNAFTGGGKNPVGEDGSKVIDKDSVPAPLVTEEQKLNDVKEKIDKDIKENNLTGEVSTKIEERGLVISFKDEMLFKSGDASIRKSSVNDLKKIAEGLSKIPNYIRVEGHTDNVPISNSMYSSNWQLSSVRAANVAQFISDNSGINPSKLSAIGYGENRPIADNKSEDGRLKNRRVDIVILSSKLNDSEDLKKQK